MLNISKARPTGIDNDGMWEMRDSQGLVAGFWLKQLEVSGFRVSIFLRRGRLWRK